MGDGCLDEAVEGDEPSRKPRLRFGRGFSKSSPSRVRRRLRGRRVVELFAELGSFMALEALSWLIVKAYGRLKIPHCLLREVAVMIHCRANDFPTRSSY